MSPQLHFASISSLYWLYLQAHTFTAAGHTSKGKPVVFKAPVDWPLMSFMLSWQKEKHSDIAFAIMLMCLQAALSVIDSSSDIFPRLHMGECLCKWIKSCSQSWGAFKSTFFLCISEIGIKYHQNKKKKKVKKRERRTVVTSRYDPWPQAKTFTNPIRAKHHSSHLEVCLTPRIVNSPL